MKNIRLTFLVLFLGLFFGNCLVSSTTPAHGGGGFITITTQHVYGNSQGSQISSAKVMRSGESCSLSSAFFINFFFYGKGGSIEDAAKKAEITKIAVVDRSSLNIFGKVFYRDCIVVWGE